MRTMKLKLLFVCAVMMLLLGTSPKALALVVGFNPDIHMDIPGGVIANDFHVQGRLESGNWGGNWSNPPVLISHIDGGFPNFQYSITPDLSDPCGQNWYNFTADWSGTNYPYCSIIHLGLFFDVTCNNVAVNLVGWWTKDGRPIPPNIVPPPLNGGAVPIPGFNVRDIPHLGMPQMISLFNHSRDGGGGGSGIYTEIVQMDLVSLTKEELEAHLGPIPAAFKELRVDGNQARLPWVQVENEKGLISEGNPQPLMPDSFFDVFLDVSGPIHPVTPITIPPGGFLVARERVKFINNNRQPDIRWDWMIHGAHESDLGDAPDSSNSFSFPPPIIPMTAYPMGGPPGVIAHYPTVYQMGSPPFGPIHWAAPLIAFLGPMVSSETEADIGPDMDPTNNIIPLQDKPDLDNFDDGVIFPIVLPHCQQATFDYWVNIAPPWPPPMPQTPTLYVNVWFDWNRDGDWDDTMQCPGTTAPILAPEWAVQNQVIVGLLPGMNKITTPQFMPWHPATGDVGPIWMRITLSEQRWASTAGVLGNGGCGPQYGYIYGETEDYYFVPEVPPTKLDFGDAPEGSNAIAYPATGVTGSFPTCVTIGPAGWIQHTNFGAWFGPTVDFEGDGNAGLCPFGCFPPYDQDECFADGDAGLLVPLPYTIDAALNVVPCPQCSSGTPLGDICQTAFWGTNIDIDVHNHMPNQTIGYVNLLIDWDQNGQWSGSSNCPTAATPEHVLVNFPVPNPYDGPLSGLMPFGAGFLIGPNRGYVWARFTITERPVPLPKPGWNGEGSFEDGETEDYLLEIGKVYEPKPLVEHSKWSQPPIEWNPQSRTPVYCGWDAPSFKEEWEPPPIWQIVADDFRCLGSMPITSIHWWGSYIRWMDENPPAVKPTSWRIGFWSNVPPSPFGGISHPGKLLWQIDVPADRVKEEWAGSDQVPDMIPETCFQYYVNLTSKEYFRQAKEEPNTVDSVFWLSIAAIYQPGPPPPNPWGWKTRPWHWMDDAVTFTIAGDFKPGYVPDPSIIHPLEYCGQSYDTAFELDTDPNYIKWEQAYTGLRDWPHYEDEESMATVDTVVEPLTKWSQKPDLNPGPTITSIDVDATFSQMPVYPPQVLADDFNCITTGPITDIYVWGSWLHDALPDGGPQNVLFTLSLHADLPVGDPRNPKNYSMPGQLLWMRQFTPGEFEVMFYMEIPEGYYMPCTQWYLPQDHFGCWLYHFKLQPGEFTQTGTTTKPIVYWLDVQAMPIATNPEVRFGWKASERHWNDDAVFAIGAEPIQVPGPWQNLTYPMGHPYAGRTIDLAFEIVTLKQYEQFNLIRQVADDWKCERQTPVTAAVWWGSYIGYGYEACQCQTTTPRPTKPDYFLLSIWTNVPANPYEPNSFSHPGEKKWEYRTNKYDEVLVGYDKHPEPGEPGTGGYEPVFRYSVKLPQTSWFRQKDVNEVFWFSVVAVYDQNDPTYPWGWTNHQCVAWEPKGLDELGYWKLNETSGIIASDSSGNGNDGTLIGGPTWTAGRICGGALQLDGVDDYVDTGYTTDLPVWTISVWVIGPNAPSGRTPTGPVHRENNYQINWDHTDPNFRGAAGLRVGSRWYPASFGALQANKWYHLAATYDGETLNAYKDGVLITSNTAPSGNPDAETATLKFGRHALNPQYFRGTIDDVRIYNRALKAGEVKALTDMGQNDDAAAWELDPTGQWKWTPLTDQTGRSEDMSFVLFTEPGCFPSCHKDYFDWLLMGKPACWCYLRQCHGDTDNKTEGGPKTGYYYVHFNDLNVLLAGWNVREPALPPIPSGPGIVTCTAPSGVPCVCADFKHDQEGGAKTGYYRVHFNDLNILLASWNILEPAPPPIPSGPGVKTDCLNCP